MRISAVFSQVNRPASHLVRYCHQLRTATLLQQGLRKCVKFKNRPKMIDFLLTVVDFILTRHAAWPFAALPITVRSRCCHSNHSHKAPI